MHILYRFLFIWVPRFVGFMWVLSLTGSLEDWDAAVQKTETKLNRVSEQRARVSPN